jgi:hypothetical protein
MKTRIKVVERVGGTGYFPQVKGWLFWYYIEGDLNIHDGSIREAWPQYTIEQAQFVIDSYIAVEGEKEERRLRNVVKKVSYVKYP